MYSICFYCVHCIFLLISFKSGLYFYFCNHLVEFVSGKNTKQSYPDLGIYPLNQYTFKHRCWSYKPLLQRFCWSVLVCLPPWGAAELAGGGTGHEAAPHWCAGPERRAHSRSGHTGGAAGCRCQAWCRATLGRRLVSVCRSTHTDASSLPALQGSYITI